MYYTTVVSDKKLQVIGRELQNIFPQLKDIVSLHVLGEGWGSLVVAGNNDIVFRIAKNKIIQKKHAQQIHTLPLIAQLFPQIKIPLPLYYVQSSSEFPYGVMGYKKIPGVKLSHSKLTGKETAGFAIQIAFLLYSFHTSVVDRKLKESTQRIIYTRSSMDILWKQTKQWLEKNLSGDEFTESLAQWKEATDFLPFQSVQKVLVHGDPWYENILVDDNSHIVGIVDFDKVSIADPAIDFVVQQLISSEFLHQVIYQYQKLGGVLGDNFLKRVDGLTKVKALEDLLYGIKTNNIHPDSAVSIKRAFLS